MLKLHDINRNKEKESGIGILLRNLCRENDNENIEKQYIAKQLRKYLEVF